MLSCRENFHVHGIARNTILACLSLLMHNGYPLYRVTEKANAAVQTLVRRGDNYQLTRWLWDLQWPACGHLTRFQLQQNTEFLVRAKPRCLCKLISPTAAQQVDKA